MATRNLLVRAGFDASGMKSGVKQANAQLSSFGKTANSSMSTLSTGISSSISKIGKLLASAFAVGKLVQFGRECINLGSDLSEVQNVVDVTFGSMADQVNEFAAGAMTQFGLSETAAKQYTSTMGAMLKSMGLTANQAFEMSKSITGLSADMASFYNLDADTAFEKIRSGISGETEPLKQLGINMSVANMQAYAMSQGITTAYSKMSQAEQTLLRYNYLLSVTSDAQGDFARTSNSWANQTRVLAMQFDALKAEIGQGLIAVLTPVVQALNILINKLRVAAGYFRSFMELIFGKQSTGGGSGVAEITGDTTAIADSAEDASDSVGGIGDAAKSAGDKAAKAAKGATASFDELHQLTKNTDSGSGGSSGGGSGGGASGLETMGGAVDVDLGEVEEGASKLDNLFNGIVARLKEIASLFTQGFQQGFNTADLSLFKDALVSVKDGLKNIFSDGTVLKSFENMINSFALATGQVVGAFTSIGISLATNLIGGLGKYLNQNTELIKQRLINIFSVKSEMANLIGDFSVTLADIASVFSSSEAQQITANMIGLFTNSFLGVVELALKFGRDILNCIVQPIIENKDLIKQALMQAFDITESFTGTITQMVTDIFASLNNMYDTYLEPAFTNIKDGISSLVGAILETYNKYVAPLLQKWGDDFRNLYESNLKPMFDKVIEVVGKLIECISVIWKNVLEPFVGWLLQVIAPEICGMLDIIWSAVKNVVAWLADIIKGLMTTLGGLLDFLTGVFTLDWEKAWEGITEIVSGVAQTAYDFLIGGLEKIVTWLKDTFVTAWCSSREMIENIFEPLTTWFDSNVVQPLSSVFTSLWLDIQQKAEFAWTFIKGIWGLATSWFNTTIITPIKTAFTNWGSSIKQIGTTAWNSVKSAWQSAASWFKSTIITPIQNAFTTLWSGLATKCSNAFNTVKNSAKNGINGIIGFFNRFISGINSKLSFNMPEVLGGGHVGFSIPQIPMLARGGVMDTPTLAMFGEDGAEAVVPLENNTEWTGQVATLLANALLPFMSNSSNGSPQNVSLEMDGTIFARTVTPLILKEIKRLGVEF